MKIYPTIAIMDGKDVNRVAGRQETPEASKMAPLEASRAFAAAGSECLHIVDVDGTLLGGRRNSDMICEIIDNVAVPVQVAGGIRTTSAAQWWFDCGAFRVGLVAAALKDLSLVREACTAYPVRVFVTVAARRDNVLVEGWREETTITAIELAKDLEKTGIAKIMFIYLDRDKDPNEHSRVKTMRMGEALEITVISSGTVATLDEVSMLKYLPNIDGCIIGRALFGGQVDLKEAIATASASYTSARFL